jgi:predicted AAA+ superfamily ATPase
VDTIRRWISLLEGLYFCYTVRPWFTNVPKSLRKQPKIFLWDWSLVQDPGARKENFVAAHLLKAVHFWTDMGIGNFELFYLRDKMKREVDFIVVKDDKPWFLVEVKSSARRGISPTLHYFYNQLGVQHAFQVVFDLDFIERNCFAESNPTRVPVATFLTQLV